MRHITFGGDSRLCISASKSLRCFFRERTLTVKINIGVEGEVGSDIEMFSSLSISLLILGELLSVLLETKTAP